MRCYPSKDNQIDSWAHVVLVLLGFFCFIRSTQSLIDKIKSFHSIFIPFIFCFWWFSSAKSCCVCSASASTQPLLLNAYFVPIKARDMIPAPKIVINMSAIFILPKKISDHPISHDQKCNRYFHLFAVQLGCFGYIWVILYWRAHGEPQGNLLLT